MNPDLFHKPRKASAFRTLALAIAAAAALTGCAGKALKAPPPVHTKVFVPVVAPCEVEQVELSPLETAKGVPNDIYDAVRMILIDREVLQADREKLKAANTDPCPTSEELSAL